MRNVELWRAGCSESCTPGSEGGVDKKRTGYPAPRSAPTLQLHVQCDETGRLCGFDLITATVDERKLLDPLTRWMQDGIVVGDGGYLSKAKADDSAQRGVYLPTPTRKTMRHLASPFPLACLRLRHRVEELFAFLTCAFGLVRSTHRAPYALPIHLLGCLLAYSL